MAAMTFNDLPKVSDKEIQMFLREIDSRVLSRALKGSRKAVQDSVWRNVSARVGKMIEGEMEHVSGDAPKKARAECEETLAKLVKAGTIAWPPGTPKKKTALPKGYAAQKRKTIRAAGNPLGSLSLEEVDDLLMGMAQIARTEGILKLEEMKKATPDPLLETGLGLIVDGTEPELVLDVIDELKASMIREYAAKLDKAVAAVMSTQAGRHPMFIEMQLKAIF